MSAAMIANSPPNYRVLGEDLVGMVYVKKLFGKSELTIMLWRKNKGLPFVKVPGDVRDTIRFDPAELRAWARARNVRVFLV